MQVLVFATNNAHKAHEVELVLGPGYQIKTLKDIGCLEDIEETENTLEGNALLKARYVKEKYGYDCFSEDAGLEVSALNGAPGVHTARYAGPSRDANDNMDLLLRNLDGHTDRSAQFRAVIALIQDDKETLLEGVCKGQISLQKQGTEGFGYDPIFIPEGYEQTFAQLGDDVKTEISHRAKATRKLVEVLTMDDGRWTMDDGRWTMDDGRWTMDDGRWTMDDGRWTMDDGKYIGCWNIEILWLYLNKNHP